MEATVLKKNSKNAKVVVKADGKTIGKPIEFRVDKYGIIHSGIGKMSFTKDQINSNLDTLMKAVLKARPASLKGVYVNKITLSSTMGPGIKIDLTTIK